MQRDLDALMDWGSTWGMIFNAKKCNIMRVSRSRKPLQHFYSLGNEILQEVSDAKYLGIQIDNKLDWNKHISTVAAKGQSKLAFLNRNLKGCPKKLRDTAYTSTSTAYTWLDCCCSTQHKLYSLLLPPAMGARFYRFLGRPAKWTRWLAGAAATKSG